MSGSILLRNTFREHERSLVLGSCASSIKQEFGPECHLIQVFLRFPNLVLIRFRQAFAVKTLFHLNFAVHHE